MTTVLLIAPGEIIDCFAAISGFVSDANLPLLGLLAALHRFALTEKACPIQNAQYILNWHYHKNSCMNVPLSFLGCQSPSPICFFMVFFSHI